MNFTEKSKPQLRQKKPDFCGESERAAALQRSKWGIASEAAANERGSASAKRGSTQGEVLSDPTYRENACRIQKAIVKANGLSAAADLIEHPLGVPTAPPDGISLTYTIELSPRQNFASWLAG